MTTSKTEGLFNKLKEARRLPSPPGTALRVLELCRAEDTDVKEIADAVMADPALSGRLLRYANSAVMGSRREVATIRDAVLQLGLRTVKLTALGFSLAAGLESSCPHFSLKRFWTESIVTAILARRFAPRFNTDREEAFTAGLLARIGRLALAHGLPDDYAQVAYAVEREKADELQAERSVFGTDSVAFGTQLLTQWAVPTRLIQAIAHQLEPAGAAEDAQPLARALQIATTLAPTFVRDDPMAPSVLHAARHTVEKELQLDEAAWQTLAEEAIGDYRQVAEVFDIELDAASVFDLYGEAQEEATRVGIVAQLESSRAQEQNKDLLRRATTDALTGIANRARFDERIAELTALNEQDNSPFALLLFDIDHFKKFNDTHGHAVGDLVLQHVAKTVQQTMRNVDLLARYGGEEFAILAPKVDMRAACTIAARTRRRVEEMQVRSQDQVLQVTISVGLALSTDYASPPTIKQIIDDADEQLYLSKDGGRNTWSYRGRCAAQLQAAAAPVAS